MLADLARYRHHLKDARRYLVGRLAEEDDPDRQVPDTGWLRILDSIQGGLEAVEAVVAEDEKGTRHVP